MKKVLIVIFAFLFAISGGLLTYGIIQGPKKEFKEKPLVMTAPSVDLFLGEYADQRIDMAAVKDQSIAKNQKAAEMIVKASYNNILINQFYYKAHVDFKSTKSSDKAFSDYYRAKNGVNMFYMTLAYTGTLNLSTVRIDYVDQRVKQENEPADYIDGAWSLNLKSPKASKTSLSLPDLTPYNIYSWYDFPLDLGGERNNTTSEGRTEAIDGKLIDPNSVEIEEVYDGEHPFYRLTFKAIIADTQASKESMYRFADSCGGIKNVDLSELSFTVEIWKEAGVFRSIGFNARAEASLNGKRGEVVINKLLQFSYNDVDCSVAAHIKDLADQYTEGWITKFSSKNQEKIQEELAALPKEEENAAAQDA